MRRWLPLLLLLPAPSLAQGTFVARDAELDALLEQAVLEEARGSYDGAARKYLEVEERLDALKKTKPDLSPVTEVGPGLDRGVAAHLAERVRALPPDAQAVFLRAVDPRAGEALRRALANGDLEALEGLVARWPLASCVDDALRNLAELAFERGELTRARRALRQLESRAGATGGDAPRQPEEEVARRRRVALLSFHTAVAARDRGAAEEALLAFEARGGDPKAPRPWGARTTSLRALVEEIPAGNAAGPAGAVAGFDPGALLRTIPLERPEVPAALRRVAAPSLLPLRDPERPLLYLADSKTVRAVAFGPGVRGWSFSFADPDGEPSRVEAMLLRPALGQGCVLATLHRNRPAKLPPPAPPPPPAPKGKNPPPPPEGPPIERQADWCVVALDPKTGKLLWDAAAQEPFARWAREAEWIGPPLHHQGSVWVVAVVRETDLRAHLLRLDAASGRLVRATFLASRPGPDPLGLATPQAAPAVTADGLIVAATGIGAIAAVEPARGELAWVHRYASFPDPSLGPLLLAGRRFRVHEPLVSGAGPLVVAPVDAAELLALDPLTGQPAWSAPRGDARWCAEGPSGEVLLLGRTLRALARDSGRVRFVGPELGAEPIAPPLVLGEELLAVLPDQLVRLSLLDGAELSRWRFQEPAAEAGPALLLSTAELATVGPERLHVWRDQGRTRKELLDRYDGARLDLPLGRFLARRGDDAAALTHLERAAKSGELDQTARLEARGEAWTLLVRQAGEARGKAEWMALAERALAQAWGRRFGESASGAGFDAEPEPEATVSPLQRDLRQRAAPLLREWAEANEQAGGEGLARAARAWRALLELHSATLVPIEPGRKGATLEVRTLARQRLFALAARSPEALAAAEPVAAEALRAALAAGSEEGLSRVAERFPWSARAADACWELARLHESRGRRREAGEALQRLVRGHPGDPRRPEALARLAAALERQGRSADARQVLGELLALEPEPEVTGGDASPPLPRVPARTWAEPIRQRLVEGWSPGALAAARATAGLASPLQRVLRGRTELAQTGEALLIPTHPWSGPPDLALVERQGRLRLVRVPSGEEVLRLEGLPPARGVNGPVFLGERLLVSRGDRVEAWAVAGPEQGRRAWEARVAPGDGAAISEQAVHQLHPVGSDAALVLTGRGELVLLDGATGAERWRKDAPFSPGEGVLVAGDLALALAGGAAQVAAHRLSDGSLAWSWPPAGRPPAGRLSRAVLHGETLLFVDEGLRATALDARTGKLRWAVTAAEDAWVMELVPSADGRAVVARIQGQGGPGFVVLDARTGRELWRDEGTGGRVPGQAIPGGPRAALNLTVSGEGAVYTLRTIGGEHQLWAQAPATGQLLWRWELPRGGPVPPALIETPTAVLVPRNGAFGEGSSVSVLARGTGEVEQTLQVPGRRLVGAGVEARAGTLLVTTDRGLFGYARREEDRVAEEVVLAAQAFLAAPDRPPLRLRLASALAGAGRHEEALGLLEEGILAEGVAEEGLGRMLEALSGLAEDAADERADQLQVRYLPRPPAIDGELDDWWRPWSSVELRRPRAIHPIQSEDGTVGGWAGPEDLSARVYLGWDARHFYFAIDVDDTLLRPYDSEAERWIGDCLLIAIDCLGDGGEVVMSDDVLLSLALTLPKKKKDEEEEAEGEDEDRPQGTYFVRRKEDGSGAVYEAAIPWAMFKQHGVNLDEDAGPDPGLSFGLDLILTDDDGERGLEGEPGTRGARKSLQLCPGVLLHEDKSRLWQGYVPDRFVKVTLERPGPGPGR